MEIRAYQPGDEEAILGLFQLSFNKTMTMDYWKWRFLDNPFENSPMIDLMWDDEKLIGHYALSPVEMLIDGLARKTALSMTTMTHPDYGGRGVFSSLASSLYKRLEDDGYEMVWGFPNNNSHYGFKKNLGWNDVAIQPMLSLPVSNIILEGIEKEKYSFKSQFDDKIVATLNKSEKRVRLNKTEAYLSWRYLSNPMENYKILASDNGDALIVYKVIDSFQVSGGKEVDIMEIDFRNDKAILLSLLLEVLEQEGNILQFNLWDSLFSEGQLILEKVLFRNVLPMTYLGCRYFHQKNSFLSDYRNWEIGLGYSDVF